MKKAVLFSVLSFFLGLAVGKAPQHHETVKTEQEPSQYETAMKLIDAERRHNGIVIVHYAR